jgi:hypothetical protein
MQYVMMQFSLPLTLMTQLVTRFDGLARRNGKLLPIIRPKFKLYQVH